MILPAFIKSRVMATSLALTLPFTLGEIASATLESLPLRGWTRMYSAMSAALTPVLVVKSSVSHPAMAMRSSTVGGFASLSFGRRFVVLLLRMPSILFHGRQAKSTATMQRKTSAGMIGILNTL